MKPASASLVLVFLCACVAAEEPPRVTLPLVVETGAIERVTTDLGFEVDLRSARLVARDFRFATAGELHARARPFSLVSRAHAHPGHFQAGSVTGELLGAFAFDLAVANAALGHATLLPASYASASFTFGRGGKDAGISESDPLNAHTALLRAVATLDGRSVDATFTLDSPEGRELTDAPFEAEITASTGGALGLRLAVAAPAGGATLFDGVDFFALDPDEDGAAHVGPESELPADVEAYQALLRRLQTHDHFEVLLLPEAAP